MSGSSSLSHSEKASLVLAILGFLIGGGFPNFFLDFREGEWEYEVYMATFCVTGVAVVAAAKFLGEKYKCFRAWVNRPLLGTPIAVFVGSLLASLGAALFAIAPVPNWIHIVLLVPIAIAGLIAFAYLARSG